MIAQLAEFSLYWVSSYADHFWNSCSRRGPLGPRTPFRVCGRRSRQGRRTHSEDRATLPFGGRTVAYSTARPAHASRENGVAAERGSCHRCKTTSLPRGLTSKSTVTQCLQY